MKVEYVRRRLINLKSRRLHTRSIVLLAAVLAMTVGGCAGTPAPAERPSPVLFDFARVIDTRTVETNDAGVALSGNGVLRVTTGHTARWPGVTLRAPHGRWDLSSFAYLSVSLTNPGDDPLRVYCRVDNPGADGVKNSVTGSVMLRPAQTDTLIVPLSASRFRLSAPLVLIGIRGAPLLPQALDPARVIRLLLFTGESSRDHVFDVRTIQAGGAVETMDAATFLPFIDAFGQFSHADWPGKTEAAADLPTARAAEEGDLAAWPGPDRWDQYGGWDAGPRLKSMGFFHTEKYRGKWWLVDPRGRLFWSHGVDCVTARSDTPIMDRERYFRFLPPPGSPLSRFYDKGYWAPHGYYRNRIPYTTFDFSRANLFRKYGSPWETAFGETTQRRLRSWGFNTIANWSDRTVYELRRTPYVGTIHFDSKTIAGSAGYWTKFYDVFDQGFRANLRAQLEKEKGHAIGDPWCIGFFVHNELPWGDETSLAVAVLQSPARQPAKIAFLSALREKYQSIARLNAVWGTAHRSWEALSASRGSPSRKRARDDLTAFYSTIAATYFRIVREELTRAAPGQLYLGCRFAWSNDRAVRAASEYCDVISFNLYDTSVVGLRLPEGVDKPVIIGEFHFGALDRGLFSPGLQAAADQNDRAAKYLNYVQSALAHHAVVGVHWFQYKDQPVTGRGDGENFQIGLIDVCDRPYPETVAAAREIGYRLYERRTTASE